MQTAFGSRRRFHFEQQGGIEMLQTRTRRALLAVSFLLSTIAASADAQLAPAARTPPPDSTLYTTYSFAPNDTTAYLSVCGSTQESDGCYGGANLGPFGHAGALIEGNPSVDASTNTVTRFIYVVDDANAGSGVKLYVYKKTDAITPSTDTVTVTLSRSISLPLRGGSGTKTFMAANKQFLYVGTSKSPFALQIRKRDLTATQVGGFSPPSNVSGITSDGYGFITVTFGSGFAGGEYVFDPAGHLAQDGGGAEMMLGTAQGLTTADLPASGSSSFTRPKVQFKAGVAGD
jgi:hypothetical protein